MNQEIEKATPKHIESVKKRIQELKANISGHFLDLFELLKEIRDRGYHLDPWGFKTFGLWLEQSGLDMSERAAYYGIRIVEMGEELKIPREKLENVKLSKLKEMTTLDFKKDGKKIKQLVDGCIPDKDGNELTLDDVREQVQKIKGGSDKVDTFVFITLKLTKTAKEQVIDPAIEMMRAEYGSTVDLSGNEEPVDISPGRAIEMICADYLSGVHAEEHTQAAPVEVNQKALPAAPGEVTSEVINPLCQVHGTPLILHRGNGNDEIDKYVCEDCAQQDLPIEGAHEDEEVIAPEPPHTCADEKALLEQAIAITDKVEQTPELVEKLAGEGLKIDSSGIKERLAALKAEQKPDVKDVVEQISEGCSRRAEKFKEISSSGPDLDPTHDPIFEQVKEYVSKFSESASAQRIKNIFNIGLERAERLYKYFKTHTQEGEEL
jgi:hypothetical protein